MDYHGIWYQPPLSINCLRVRVHYFSLVAWSGLSIRNRHERLMTLAPMARNATAAAIERGEYNKALEWLEQRRSVVWTHILQLRTPTDRLRGVEPELADRLLQVSRILYQGIERNDFSDKPTPPLEEEGRRRRALTTE